MEVTLKDYKTAEKSWWCPGCGDFGVLAALQKALVNQGIAPHEVAIVAGIGFSMGIMVLVSALELIPQAAADIGMPRAALAVASGVAPSVLQYPRDRISSEIWE